MKRILKMTMVLLSLLILASCSFPGLASNTDEDTISITGGITSEAQILASLVAGMVEHYTDKNTAIINNLATTTINHQAMMNGDASISAARYTGTDLTTTLNLPPEKDPKKAFATVKDEFEKRYDQTWFPSYGFENTYVFLVRKDTAQKYHLSKVSDLKNVADELVAGVDTSWINRKETVTTASRKLMASLLIRSYLCRLDLFTMQSKQEKWILFLATLRMDGLPVMI